MKRLFCILVVVGLNLSTLPLPVMGQPPGTMVVGRVGTLQGNPVPGIKILVKDPAARVISEAVTDMRGRYALSNLTPHRYQLTLDPLNSPYKGQTVVSAVGSEGLTVNWTVSETMAALATAAPAAADPDPASPPGGSPGTGALIFLGGTGLITGILAGAGILGEHGNNGSASQ